MGFLDARRRLLDCLRSGDFGHWPRKDLFLKNWLAVGRVSEEEVIRLLVRCTGSQYRPGKQASPAGTTVHEFLPRDGDVRWHIKAYLDEDTDTAVIEAVFMSVHPSGDSHEDLEGRRDEPGALPFVRTEDEGGLPAPERDAQRP